MCCSLAGAGDMVGRRVPLLLSVGFATMFLGDILWSVAKIGGKLSVGRPAATCCTSPVMHRWPPPDASTCAFPPRRPGPRSSSSLPLAQSLPLRIDADRVPGARSPSRAAEIGSPATVMTIIVSGLALLVMVRQALVLRDDALIREQRAASYGRGPRTLP